MRGRDATTAGGTPALLSDTAGFGGAIAGLAAADSPSTAMVPTTVFTPTVVPSVTLISWRTPEAGAGISASTLSVEISKRGSSRWTLSPGFLSHLVIVPSTMDSPICGMMMSVGMMLSLRPTVVHTRSGANEHYSVPRGARWSALQAKNITAEFAEKCRGGRGETCFGTPLRLGLDFALAGQPKRLSLRGLCWSSDDRDPRFSMVLSFLALGRGRNSSSNIPERRVGVCPCETGTW